MRGPVTAAWVACVDVLVTLWLSPLAVSVASSGPWIGAEPTFRCECRLRVEVEWQPQH